MRNGEHWTVQTLARALRAGECSAREAALDCLERITACEPEVHAFLTVTRDEALAAADRIDARRAAGEELPPLAGIPMAIKDNICTKGVRTTCASRMLENFIPPYDADAAERLHQAGAVLLGKLNMDEFAMGSDTGTSAFGPTANPLDVSRVPGGSSGGSAAAVAAGEAVFALGSDTGGSVRQPAALCGVVGLRPTYGRISRYGLTGFAPSLDQVGLVTRDVPDCAAVLAAVAGFDPRDATSSRVPVDDYLTGIGEGVRGMRAALVRESLEESSPGVRRELLRAAARLESLGARVDELSLPFLRDMLPAYHILSSAEASSNLARFDGIRYGFSATNATDWQERIRESRSRGFGREVKRRILLGTFVLTKEQYGPCYEKARRLKGKTSASLRTALSYYDFLLLPTSPEVAWKREEKRDPVAMYRSDLFVVPASIAGLPALSVPFGMDQGLPVGMQLVGRAFGEKELFRAAHALEEGKA